MSGLQLRDLWQSSEKKGRLKNRNKQTLFSRKSQHDKIFFFGIREVGLNRYMRVCPVDQLLYVVIVRKISPRESQHMRWCDIDNALNTHVMLFIPFFIFVLQTSRPALGRRTSLRVCTELVDLVFGVPNVLEIARVHVKEPIAFLSRGFQR